jgi:hypothetical protein
METQIHTDNAKPEIMQISLLLWWLVMVFWLWWCSNSQALNILSAEMRKNTSMQEVK